MSNKIEIKKNKSKYIVRVIDCNICCESKDIIFFKKCDICKNAICESCYVKIFYNTEKCPYCRKLLELDEVILELYYDFEDQKEISIYKYFFNHSTIHSVFKNSNHPVKWIYRVGRGFKKICD